MAKPKIKAKAKPKVKKSTKKAAAPKLNPLDDPNALTAPLTPRTLDQQVGASANLAYGGAEQDLAGQQRQADVTAVSIPSWFADYRAAQAHAEEATKQVYAGAVAGQQAATNSTYALDQQAAGQQQQAMSADAATRGATVDPKIAAEAQQAALSRRSAGDAQTNLTMGLGAANVGYRAGQSAVASGQQLKAQLDQQGRKRTLNDKGLQLAKDKGNYAATTKQKLTDAEHTKQLENKAFGLNAQKAANDVALTIAGQKNAAAISAADNATSSANTTATITAADARNQANIDARKREGHLTRLTKKKTAATIAAAGGITPAERRRRNTAINDLEGQRTNAVNYATSLNKTLSKTTPVVDPATGKPFPASFVLRRQLEKKYPGAPAVVIDYALAAALGSKAGVTKKGQPDAAKRYRAFMKKLADGTLSG